MKLRLKHGEGRRFMVRDIIGISVLCAVLVFAAYDKNFIEAAGPVKTFEKSDREVKIKVVVDSRFVAAAGSVEAAAEEISATVKGASEIFEKDFGIRLKICDIAVYDDGEKTASLLKFRQEISNAPCDISVLFSGRQIGDDEDTMAAAFGSKIILKARIINYASERGQARILTHELGHLFWAIHTNDGTIMRTYDAHLAKEEWDELNWRVIMFNKYKNFHKYDFLLQKFRP